MQQTEQPNVNPEIKDFVRTVPTTEQIPVYVNKSLLREMWDFIWEKKLWWLVPVLLILLFVAVLIVAGQNSALSAFIYAMF